MIKETVSLNTLTTCASLQLFAKRNHRNNGSEKNVDCGCQYPDISQQCYTECEGTQRLN